MSIIIRRATPTDASALSDLLQSLLPFILPDPRAAGASAFLHSLSSPEIAKRLDAANYVYYVAEDAGALCGYIALRDNRHLYHLFVRRDLHRTGIGRKLWEHLLSMSDSRFLTVNSAPDAVLAYRSYGFHETGQPSLTTIPAYVPMAYTRGD